MNKAPAELGKFTGADLARWRADNDLSQARMAEAVGISRNWVIAVERDNTELTLTQRLALAAYEAGLAPVSRKPRAKRR